MLERSYEFSVLFLAGSVCFSWFTGFVLAFLEWQVVCRKSGDLFWFSAVYKVAVQCSLAAAPRCHPQRMELPYAALCCGRLVLGGPGLCGVQELCSVLPQLPGRPFCVTLHAHSQGYIAALFSQLQVISYALLGAGVWNGILCICLITMQLSCL